MKKALKNEEFLKEHCLFQTIFTKKYNFTEIFNTVFLWKTVNLIKFNEQYLGNISLFYTEKKASF